ncbi:hypothetical protein CRT23_24045 [Methylobacterium sp. V23]|nr:hypothetical protein CRT23_24045 [Methylobacterium sp. V23]
MAAAPETDEAFRGRILRIAEEQDLREVRVARKRDLDVIGRKYGRFRYGVALAGTEDTPRQGPGG